MDIIAKELSKKYKNKTVLDSIDFQINNNTILGVMGKNGAGKTTLNKLISGLILPTTGQILIGNKAAKDSYLHVNLLSENISIYQNMSAADNLKQIFLINNLKPDKKRIAELLDIICIDNIRKPVKYFSLGMKRRLQVVMSTMIVPRDIIILDEPTNGLDINGLLWLKKQIQDFKNHGRTVIISSHAINELETIFTEYMILVDGKIVEHKDINFQHYTELHLVVPDKNREETIRILNSLNLAYKIVNNIIKINLYNENIQEQIFTMLSNNKIIPTMYNMMTQSLVDKFRHYLGDTD